ncbi:MAG: C-terminal helicase domain-containing protein [Gemmatimonadota bacterium]
MTEAAITAIRAGRSPGRETLRSLIAGDDAVQPDLFDDPEPLDPGEEMLRALGAYADAVSRLQKVASCHPSDAARFRLLEQTLKSHASDRCVMFTHSARTALAVWRALRNRFRIACLTGRGALIASGRLPRREVIEAFAPSAAPTTRAARIDALVTTDVLSEGVSLHGAATVIHLDLPWTASRLDQRVGRLRRLGSPHARVTVVTIAPPASAERFLGIVKALIRKAGIADRLVGARGEGLDSLSLCPLSHHRHAGSAPADIQQRIRDRIARLLAAVAPAQAEARGAVADHDAARIGSIHVRDHRPDAAPIAVAGCRSRRAFALAVLPGTGQAMVLQGRRGVSTSPRAVLRSISMMEPVDIAPEESAVTRALVLLGTRVELEATVGRSDALLTRTHRRVLRVLSCSMAGPQRRGAADRIAICQRSRELVERSLVAAATFALDGWLADVTADRASTDQILQLIEMLQDRRRPPGASPSPGLLLLGVPNLKS